MAPQKFLFTTIPSNDLGLLTRSLPIAGELARRGHQVAFCSPAPAPSKLIAEAGFDNLLPRHPLYHLLTCKLNLRDLYRLVKSAQFKQDFGHLPNFLYQLIKTIPTKIGPMTAEVWSVDHAGALVGMRSENFLRSMGDALGTLMVDYGADVVVDFFNPFACLAARAVRKPLVTVIQADAHPTSRGFMWWQDPPPNLPTAVPVINKVLAGYDLPPISQTEELCIGELTLVLGIPETDPLPEAAEVSYIGPVLWEKPEARLPAWVEELSPEQPVIWLYSGNPRYAPGGSSADSAVVLHACIEGLSEEDVQVVLTTGHHPLPQNILPLPPNFRHEPFVPGLAMAEKSDLLIHHGGYGSCQTGLYTGTPAVIIPTYSERESNARRVAAVGAGDFIVPRHRDAAGKKKSVSAAEVRAAVKRVLADPSFTANARRISKILQTYGGASAAASLIEKFSSG